MTTVRVYCIRCFAPISVDLGSDAVPACRDEVGCRRNQAAEAARLEARMTEGL